MKVQFVDNYTINIGVSGISSILKRDGFEVGLSLYQFSNWCDIDLYSNPARYYDFDKIAQEILASKPDVIGFSVFSANFQFYRHAVAAIKKVSNIPVIVGGVFPSIAPKLFMEESQCDVVFRGEADVVASELFAKVAKRDYKGLPNIVYRTASGGLSSNDWTSYLDDIDSIPFADHTLYPKDPDHIHMIGSRGCPKTCTYCSSGVFTRLANSDGTGRIRMRKIELIIEEIKQVQKVDPRKNVFFWDDFFITSVSRMREFVDIYNKEVNVPFLCIAFPTMISDEMAKLLKEGGCRSIGMGFQTANNDYKFNVLKRRDKKESVARAASNLRKYDIKYSLDHILNLPGETREHIGESLDFYVENKVPYLQVNFLNYYPDSEITQYAYKNGFMTDEQYAKVMKNASLGEQTFKGTILDEEAAELQVKYAILFKLVDLLPGPIVKFIFKKNIYKLFPTNRKIYYGVSLVAFIKVYGVEQVMRIINMFFPFMKDAVKSLGKAKDIVTFKNKDVDTQKIS